MDETTAAAPTETAPTAAEATATTEQSADTVQTAPADAGAGASSEAEAAPPQNEPEPEASISEDGTVRFSDEFLGIKSEPEQPEAKPQEPQEAQEQKPAYYTQEELNATPFDQWDVSRLNGDVKDFVPIVQRQMQQMAAARARMAQQPQQEREKPQPMSQKDIFALAQKTARQTLGLSDDDELDMYDPEHVQALSLATQDIKAQDARRVANAERISREQDDMRRFTVELEARPDYQQFDQWVKRQAAAEGRDLETEFSDWVKKTGDIAAVQRFIANAYGTFQRVRAGGGAKPAAQQQRPKVPAVESGTGAAPAAKKIDLRAFGAMDEDEQANALMAMGYV